MKEQSITLPSHYIIEALSLANEMAPNDIEGVLTRFEFDRRWLTRESVTLEWQYFYQLMQTIILLTEQRHFGLLLGERLQINTHGSLGLAAMNSASTLELVNLIREFIVLRTELFSIDVEQQPTELRINFTETRPLHVLQSFLCETVVNSVINMIAFLNQQSNPVKSIHFTFDGDRELAEEICGCQVKFGQSWNGLILDTETANKPITAANAKIFSLARQICIDESHKLQRNLSVETKVQRLMLNSANGFPSLTSAARRLNMSTRTLHRHLLQENTSFREILEGVRKTLAHRYLCEQDLSVTATAYTLGYTEIANFRKAFRRWYGCSPSEYKQRQQN